MNTIDEIYLAARNGKSEASLWVRLYYAMTSMDRDPVYVPCSHNQFQAAVSHVFRPFAKKLRNSSLSGSFCRLEDDLRQRTGTTEASLLVLAGYI